MPIKLAKRLRSVWKRRVLAPRYDRNVRSRTRLLAGKLPDHLGATDLLVVGLMRDEQLHVDSFVQHHLQLGAAHIVLMDNGSIDGSTEVAKRFGKQVTVVTCDCPYATHKYAMKRFLYNGLSKHGWRLIVDMDERFDYPYSSDVSLPKFLAYLNEREYSAAAAQMLDLFSPGPISTWPSEGHALQQQCTLYDLSDINRLPYREHASNVVSNPDIRYLSGGIRRTALGVDQSLMLTKFPLLHPQRGAIPSPYSAHSCRNARIADVSCLLKHYKFHARFAEQCERIVRRKSHHNGSVEYRECLRTLKASPDIRLAGPNARVFQGTDQLVTDEFLVASDAYLGTANRIHAGSDAA